MNKFQKIFQEKSLNQESEVQTMRQILSQGLFSLDSVCKKLTKAHLRRLSTPGVADVCLRIHKKPKAANTLSIRGKSIAIISRGRMLNCDGRQFLPVMDWFVAQVKYYSNIDCYPFVIRQCSPLDEVLCDLANTYCGVLFLDDQPIPIIETTLNFFILSHLQVCSLTKCQITDAEASSLVLSRMVKKSYNGIIPLETIAQCLKDEPMRVSKSEARSVEFELEENQDLTPIEIHQIMQGKITVSIDFDNIDQIKKYFTLQNFKKILQDKVPLECNTSKLNAIVTDGTAILGLGNIGPIAGLPVMQAKSMMFKSQGGVQVVPVCIRPRECPSKTVQAILDLIYYFKAVNLEDIKAPECFNIERSLQKMNIMPVFHDDQHGTAIATLAAFINATKLADKNPSDCKVAINGAGAAGLNIATLLYQYGVKNIIVCDRAGIIYKGRKRHMNEFKHELSNVTNFGMKKGQLEDAVEKADVFVGVSAKDTFKKQWIQKMNSKPIIFALANPAPEISRKQAQDGGAYIYGSGRNGEPNQISNSVVYPGIFKAINMYNIKKITSKMKIMAAEEIASNVPNLTITQIIPSSLSRNLSTKIASRLKITNDF